ncbi:MAG: 1-(5-phosphoribosyl)-5-[(5-phosphoribosylamino)methylideneamino]imidazole-4-carboxamide isomerase [Bacteroidales bacterium]|nr:1-(5-phosphoribosyl)-5-[(5-phosphoribosylamino)methylideneamino]imidazole-4-carboxamide isomerase [Bacteroidales bacterium]MBD5247900.1 1-(5-phosphoribosyl)-5-[(5-phosphoribosylamino)methylideneamino]imidazole-4-carboxamide isomerase [Barnesiella sp.]
MIEIIPAIDIIDGRCVRLSQGDYNALTVYDASPVDMVKRFVDHGFTRIHAVDLDGAKAGRPCNLSTLEKMAMASDDARIEWGGGIKTDTDMRDCVNAGCAYAVIGSVAAREPELFDKWLAENGPDMMVLGADLRDGKIAVSGWLGTTDISIDDIVERFLPGGLSQAIVTEISRDGMLQGPAFELYTRIQSKYPDVDFTVSGGISSLADVEKCAELGLRRVIVGKALYEGRVTLDELEKISG